jgi:UPF0176 protein
MSTKINYYLLAFYKFVNIKDPMTEVKKMKRFCDDIGMKGRIYIGEEGINAQCSTNDGQKEALKLYLEANPFFKDIPDIDTKSTQVKDHQFPKMIVRYKKEIVGLGEIYDASEIKESKFKISTDEFKKVIDNGDPSDYLILDMRNNYEYELGHFKNALPAGTMTFRETENYIADYREKSGDKEVIMYCTGGIRCEKLAVLLKNSGMEKVKQLDGGVIKYTNLNNDGNWLGNLYTFDDRVSTYIGDSNTHSVIGRSHYSGKPAEEMFNCRYGTCNEQIIAKTKEYKKHFGFCSEQCWHDSIENLNIRNVEFDDFDYNEIRNKVKRGDETTESMQKLISEHLTEKLSKINFLK